MGKTRREFLATASAGVVGAVMGSEAKAETASPTKQTPQTPGAPPAFGTAPPAGPPVNVETFREAEKLVRVDFSEPHLAEAAGNWPQAMAPVYERRTGPRKLEIGYDVQPATVWDPEMLPIGEISAPAFTGFQPSTPAAPLPGRDEDIAFSTVVQLSAWIRSRKLSSERLTRIYLERLKRYQPKLNCVITLTEEHALAAGARGGRGDCGREVSWPAARDSLGRKGSAGHRWHPDYLGCGAVQGSGAGQGCGGHREAE